jgi:hypothetical protein
MSDQELIIRLVHYINCMVEGDDVLTELVQDMQRWGFWDEDGIPITEDDECYRDLTQHSFTIQWT